MSQAPVVKELLELLARHNAEIHSGCQSGCDLEVRVNGETVAEFCCHIPEPDGPVVDMYPDEYLPA